MRANIKLVANRANVSVSTVSRVLNDHPSVSENTRKRVLEVMGELNYEPNMLARGLSTDGFDAILIVYTRSSKYIADNPYFSGIMTAIGVVAENYDFDLILQTSLDEKKEMDKAVGMINSKLIKGIILLSARINSKFVEIINQLKIPMVVIGKVSSEITFDKIVSVDTDNYKDAKEIGTYFADKGHREIGIIHAPKNYYVSIDRINGFIDGLAEKGITITSDSCYDGGYSIDSAYQAALQLFCTKKITAVFTTDDMKALAVYRAAKNMGLRIPEDISVIGHNDYEFSSLLSPPLTTIRVPIYELGFVAASKLLQMIKTGETTNNQLMPTEFLKRSSVKNITTD